jgi:putative membrane protein
MRLSKNIPKRIAIAASMFIALCGTAFAHAGEKHVLPSNWSRAWSWEPGVVAPLVIAAIAYILGVIHIYDRSHGTRAIRPWQIFAFSAGWLTLVAALVSPLHKLGAVLFSAHMTQHELLMVVAAPLLALGKPLIAYLFAMPPAMRETVGRWSKARHVHTTWLWITGPLVVWAIHGLTIWVWHVPSLYEATLDNEFIHALQHTSFLVSALLFWWTLIHGRYGRLGYGVAFLYVFTTALHTSILGALLTFAEKVWYPIYDGRTLPWHLSALEDQQLGGLIMWIPSGTVFIVVGLAMFAAWIGESGKRQKFSRLQEIVKPQTGGEHAS